MKSKTNEKNQKETRLPSQNKLSKFLSFAFQSKGTTSPLVRAGFSEILVIGSKVWVSFCKLAPKNNNTSQWLLWISVMMMIMLMMFLDTTTYKRVHCTRDSFLFGLPKEISFSSWCVFWTLVEISSRHHCNSSLLQGWSQPEVFKHIVHSSAMYN